MLRPQLRTIFRYVGLCVLLAPSAMGQQAPEAETSSKPQPVPQPPSQPLGFAGNSFSPPGGDFVPVPDRWRLGFPAGYKWTRSKGILDPYNQSVLKGDYPIIGQHTFLNLSLIGDSLGAADRVPVPGDISTREPGELGFFGRGEQEAFVQQFIVSVSLFHGDAAFKPRDWEIRLTPVYNINYLHVRENGIVNIDVRDGVDRTDRHLGWQELFAEAKLFDVSPYYDFVSLRAGIQGFNSDFRGFVFTDEQLGARLFGTFASNRIQWNLAAFNTLEKDTNSGLNRTDGRGQRVGVANVFVQDFIWPGYTTEVIALYNDDRPTLHFDENGFLVRPAPVGNFQRHALHVAYVGWAGEGHIGRLDISHAFYEAFGSDDNNPIAGRRQSVNAQFAALELSVDVDWWRPILSLVYASGDKNPTDGRARGFDAIFDNPNFAGGPFSFWVRDAIPLTGAGVNLVNRNSLLPDLRTSKDEGQANYVNPGLWLGGLGFDFKLTPKVTLDANVNYLRFDHTEPIELLLFQSGIRKDIGWDYGLGVRWRPFLNQQTIITLGGAGFSPGNGFKDIYATTCDVPKCGPGTKVLYQGFASLTFAY